MTFGQQSGPPASSKQVSYLQSLLQKAGYASFREARGTFRLTQRQSNGKFTSGEASALIEQLVNGGEPTSINDPPDVGGSLFPVSESSPLMQTDNEERHRASQELLLRGVPAELLIDELVRRGYQVTERG